MVSIDLARRLALSLPEVIEQLHVDKPSFKVGKKIFATLNIPENRICVKLSEIDQDVFCSFDRTVIYPVPNAWGRQGWTLISLAKVLPETLLDALTTAYCNVAPKQLSAGIQASDLD